MKKMKLKKNKNAKKNEHPFSKELSDGGERNARFHQQRYLLK